MSEQNWDNQIGGNHYRTTEGEQHWDMVVRLFGLEAARGYLVGCATKYLLRAHIKEDGKNEIKDVDKAIHYLNKWKSVLENEAKKEHEVNNKPTSIIDELKNLKKEKFRDLSSEDLEKLKETNSKRCNQITTMILIGDSYKPYIEIGKFYKFNDPDFEGFKFIIKVFKINKNKVNYNFIRLDKENNLTNKGVDTCNLIELYHIHVSMPTLEEKERLCAEIYNTPYTTVTPEMT